ncbi:MAG: PSD1 and planctomycete cytochrome C domain-containing protein [Planctomycetales bacterium]
MRRSPLIAAALLMLLCGESRGGAEDAAITAEQTAFFEKSIRPVLVAHCYKCHSTQAQEIKGGLRLDLKEGWQTGGDSGEPAIVPGEPDKSPLIRAVRHDTREEAMPPNQPRLPDAVIADLVAWVSQGAPDPRIEKLGERPASFDWEAAYRARLDWWSLQPIAKFTPPQVQRQEWPRNDVDRFVLAALETRGLTPAPEADRRVLARRLSFTLTGLPPDPEGVERFVADSSPAAFDDLVRSLLESPHFGEHWARHWMDVVHYTDTHGYEWDAPAKSAWMYRDYLVRAFNADLPFQRLILEQIAGDLIDPRVDPATGLNETVIGPMALRLGERRHGDNADIEGVTQEAMANIIDTVSKAFLGTTVGCAQCHDHKLDPIPQRDYYALAGIFMSTRWGVRCADTSDPNLALIERMRTIKGAIRQELARSWLAARDDVAAKLRGVPADEKAAAAFPESLLGFWQRSLATPLTPEQFASERERRIAENKANLTPVADFTRPGGEAGWRWEGFGMQHGLVGNGEIVVADEGEQALLQVLPAGRWSHVWSMRLAGAVRSPLLDEVGQAPNYSVRYAAGKFSAQSMIVDNAFHCERMQFLNRATPGWLTVVAGRFSTLEGTPDQARRRAYLELVTKSLNNYFPPRTNYGGLKETDLADERSWLGVTHVARHPAGKPPLDDLQRFVPLMAGAGEWSVRIAELLHAAVQRWSRAECTEDDALLIDEALQAKLLANDRQATPELSRLIEEYRGVEKQLQPDRTIGSMADWHEGRDERLGIRGSYTEFGDEVPRGNIRLLGGAGDRSSPSASGRLEFARSVADHQNPLTARVFVNRVWLHLFGEGLVRTPDDFGHLGEAPSHPELLDYLAARFIAEGWSVKKLVTLLVTSATWRQSSAATPRALEIDPENRLWHHRPLRRLEAEAVRDAILVASGRFDAALGGPPIEPYRTATDAAKRLFSGPVDGNGRRSIYTKMTMMEPPRFLSLFNQPLPKLTTGRRDVTNVPDQALALLNDPFVVAMSRHWGERVLQDGATTPEERVGRMFAIALGRPAGTEETARLVRLAIRAAELRGVDPGTLLACQPVWQDVAHALFNLKEFVYVP